MLRTRLSQCNEFIRSNICGLGKFQTIPRFECLARHGAGTRCFGNSPSLQGSSHRARKLSVELGYRNIIIGKDLDKNDLLILARRLSKSQREILRTELNELNEGDDVEKNSDPSVTELRSVFIFQALPFIGFGFLDNFIMITAGDIIDTHIGAALCISTMAAAALGNLVSDVCGIGASGYVEAIAHKIVSPAPQLSTAQLSLKSVIWTGHAGRAVGIIIGCILGMFPLMFRKDGAKPSSELNQAQVDQVESSVGK